ncbi:MAG: alpha/beta hydrolase [Acidobacteria bacterium]|nr:MAG: alpha/beta hydrolase [Acidobacteriota bacterium]
MVRCRGWTTLLVGIILLLGYGWDCPAQRRFLTPADVNALPSKPPDHRLFYGRGSLQFGDLRLPEGSGPYPVAIVIHGGCWLSRFADVRNTAALADALRDAGIATWNIEYRRLDDPGGGWPGTFQDVARATDYLRSIAEKYHLDLHRVVVIGHSSGGHLALWVAARHRLPRTSAVYTPRPLPVRGVIALGGPGDLKRFMRHARSVCGDRVVTKLLGGTPDEVPDRYRQASPIELLPLGVPQILITGKYDRAVPPEYGQAYAEAARKSGDTVRHIIVDRAAHHEYNAPQAVTWPAIKSAVFSLLQLGDSGPSNEHRRGRSQ